MTGWYITQGYQSAATPMPWNEWIRRMVEETIPAQLADIHALCLLAGVPESGDGEDSLSDYLARYADRTDLTISIRDERDVLLTGHHIKQAMIVQLASGGGESRAIKERIRAAIAAFVILEGAKTGFTVCVSVE